MSDAQASEIEKPKVVTSRYALRVVVQSVHSEGKTIGLVPTMGALHEGHLSLVRESVRECDFTIVTIFVNPIQFGPSEDLSRYPRTLDMDLELLAEHHVDLVFAPPRQEIYPEGFSTYVTPPSVAEPLEGKRRPGHYRGVATIVLKLFNLVPAHIAYFGQKDYQQALVIRKMVCDLDLPIRLEVCPTVREPDGLAMSSRNRYLTDAQRRQATALSQSLNQAAEMVAAGESDSARILQAMRETLESAGISRIDYIALTDPETLEDTAKVVPETMALVAAYVGDVRLIDNRRIG